MKKNDFLLASINNPDFTPEDFKDIAGYSLKDTQMLKEEDYLKSNYIKSNPLFQDDSGIFSEQKFRLFYNKALENFAEFSSNDLPDRYEYSVFDTRRKAGDKVKPFGVSFFQIPNPELRSIGVIGPNKMGPKTLSDREIAQREKIYDPRTGTFEDKAPNDFALGNDIFGWIKEATIGEPLVLATYDDNGEHYDNILGKQVRHRKGQLKLNSYGRPYYERLNGRSLIGKDVLSATDILTVDGSAINKYDFLDSDGLDKSITGTVMKTAASIAPLFIPGVGEYYGGALAAREIIKALPMLYGIGTVLFTDQTNSYVTNQAAAYMQKLTTSQSDYAKEHLFSFENFGSLIADVALQWEQQQAIIKGFNKLTKANEKTLAAAEVKALNTYKSEAEKLIEQGRSGMLPMSRVKDLTGASNISELEEIIANNNWKFSKMGLSANEKFANEASDLIAKRTRLGQNLSLGYMAIISNTDVYQDALQRGASKGEAAALALGSTVGMFSVDKWLGLGEMFFQVPAERQLYRSSLRESAEEITSKLVKNEAAKETKKSLGQYFMQGIKAGRNTVNNYLKDVENRNLSIVGKSIGEGLEEVSEELVTDVVKSMGELAAKYGWIEGPTDLGAWENMGERYAMSLLGGSLGGAIFGIKEGSFQKKQAMLPLQLLVRQGKAGEVRKELKKLYEKGQLGDTDLSIDTETIKDEQGKPVLEGGKVKKVYVSADNDHMSQNEFVYNTLTQVIDQLETIMLSDRLNKTESGLFENLVLKDERFMNLQDWLQDKSYITGYQERYQDLVTSIIDNETKIAALGDSKEDQQQKEKLQESLNEKLLERDRFLNGELSLEYIQDLVLALNPSLSAGFLDLNKEQFTRNYWKKNYGRDVKYQDLTGDAQTQMDKLYEQYLRNPYKPKRDLQEAGKAFRKLTADMSEVFQNLVPERFNPEYSEWEKVVEQEKDVFGDQWDYDTQLDIESEDQYAHRNKPYEGESVEEFSQRIAQRQGIIDQHNREWVDWIRNMAMKGDYLMDENTKRQLLINLGATKEQRKKYLIKNASNQQAAEIAMNTEDPNQIIEVLRNSIREEAKDKIQAEIESQTIGKLSEKQAKEFGIEEYSFIENLPQVLDYIKSTLGLDHIDSIYDLYKALVIKKEGDPIQTLIELYNQAGIDREEQLEVDPDNPIPNDTLTKALKQFIEEYSKLTPEEVVEGIKVQEISKKIPVVDYSESNQEALIEQYYQEAINKNNLEQEAEQIMKTLTEDEVLQNISAIEKATVEKGPARMLLKYLAGKMGDETVTIDKALDSIFQLWKSQENPGEFELTETQKSYLKEVQELIDIAKSIVAAASRETWLGDGITYNKAINDFVQKHPDIMEGKWNPLYEMDKNIGESLIYSLDSFNDEINSWLKLSAKNYDDKPGAIRRAKEAYDNARQTIFRSQLSSFRLTSDFEKEGEDKDLFYFEREFHDRIQQALKQEEKIEDILKEIRESIGNNDELLQQKNSEIDEQMTTLTPYDQYMYLAAVAAADPMTLREDINKFVDATNGKLVPLITQFPGVLYMNAVKSNPQIMKAAVQSIEDLAASKGLKIPSINAVVLSGLGGGGKTEYWVNYAIGMYDPKKVWVSGPKQTQVDNLVKLNENVTGKVKTDLIDYITGGDKTLLTQFEKGQGLDSNVTHILKDVRDKLVPADIDAIVIDEATHYSNIELQLIGQWADKIGAQLFLAGDENQLGNVTKDDKANIINLNREYLIALRAPRINISLRTDNIWTTLDNKNLVRILNALRSSSDATKEQISKQVDDFVNDFHLSYYEKDSLLNGNKVVNSVTPQDILRLQSAETIAFIGDESSDTFRALKSQLPKLQAFTLEDIQGREFDYIISSIPIDKYDSSKDLAYKLNYLQKLYTIISRGRKGSLLITDNLKSDLQKYTTDSIGLSQGVKEQIIKDFKEELEALKEKYKKEEEKKESEEEKSTEEPKSEESESEEQEEELNFSAQDFDPDAEIIGVTAPTPPVSKEIQNTLEEENRDDIILESEVKEGPRRGYGDITFLGVDKVLRSRELKKGYVVKRYDWISNGKRKNVGMFAKAKGEVIATETKEKEDLKMAVSSLQASLLFGKDLTKLNEWNSLHEKIRKLLKRENMGEIRYFVVAEDYDENAHSFLRKTRIYKKNKTSFIKGLNEAGQEVDKVISVEARIPISKTEYVTITLGTVANPDVWLEGVNSREKPKKGIREWQKAQDLERAHIEEYRKELQKIVKEQEREIERPTFNLQTEINRIPGGESFRLRDMGPGISPWEANTPDYVQSPVHIITGNMKGLNKKLSDKLKGHPVIFVTANPSLHPEDLCRIWQEQQMDREHTTPVVRMLVLDNIGVSFSSLYREAFADQYRRTDGSTDIYQLPFRKQPEAVRMFVAFWNFRANLLNFNAEITDWLNNIEKDWNWLTQAAKWDREAYMLASNAPTEDDMPMSDEQFNKWLKDNPNTEHVEDIKLLREFNDSLHDKVRQFRIGYSTNGAYIRRLKLKEGNPFYKDINNTNGIYLNPELVSQYLGLLDGVDGKGGFFPQIIDKIFTDTSGLDKFQNIKYKDKKNTKTWFQKLKKSNACSITLEDGKRISIKVPEQSAMISLPFAIVDAARYLAYKGRIGKERFEIKYNETPAEGEASKYRINLEFKEGDIEVDYKDIDEALEFEGHKGILQTSKDKIEGLVGHRYFVLEHDDGTTQEMWIDTRMDTFYNLLFHGLPNQHKYNKFDTDELRATDAMFKYGFFSDPVLVKQSKDPDLIAESSTNNALFACDALPGMPYFTWSIKKKQEVKTEEGPKEVTIAKESAISQLCKQVADINSKVIGKTVKITRGKEDVALVKLQDGINKFKQDFVQNINIIDPIYKDLSKVIYSASPEEGIVTFKDYLEQYIKTHYPNISPNIISELTNIARDPESKQLIYSNDQYKMTISYEVGEVKVNIEDNSGLGDLQVHTRKGLWDYLQNALTTVDDALLEEYEEEYEQLNSIVKEIQDGKEDWVIMNDLLNTNPITITSQAKQDILALEQIIEDRTDVRVAEFMDKLLDNYRKEINCISNG